MTNTDTSIQTWKYHAGSGVAAVDISGDGETIIAGTLDKMVLSLNSQGQPHWQVKVGNQAWRVGLSNDGQTTVVGTGSTRPWDMRGRGLFCLGTDGMLRWQVELKASVWGLALSADGQTVAAGTSGKQLLCFDGQGQRLWQQDVPGLGWYAWVFGAALSADGQIVAAAAADKRVRLLERSGLLVAEFRTRGELYIVAISANGQVVATGDTKGYVYLLNRQGQLLWEERLADKVWTVALSTDGQRLLVGAGEKEKHLYTYDQSGRLLWRRFVEGSVNNLTLSANGWRVVAGTRSGGIHIFGEDGEVLHKTQADKLVRQVAISATGERIVAGSEDGYVYGFQLPAPLPVIPTAVSPQSEPQIAGTVYNIHIEQATGLAIGDKAQVRSSIEETRTASASSLLSLPNPRLVRVKGEHRTYLIDKKGTRRWIPDGPTLETIANWEDVETLASWEELAGFPPGQPLPSQVHGPRPWLVKVRNEPDIYYIDEAETRHWLLDRVALESIDQRIGIDLLADWKELESFQPGEPLHKVTF